jgi:sugar phosphate isomerase/epimerase
MEVEPMPTELLATCWTHAGDAVPVAGRHLSPFDLRARAEAVAAAGFTGIGFTINDLEAAKATYGWSQVKRICDDLGLIHLEVELLEDWWTTGSRRQESDRTRMSLLTAADVLGAQQIKIGPDVEVVPAAGLVVDIWHLERGPSTLADLAEVPGDKVFVVELNDAPAAQSTDLFYDTIHHRALCGSGTFDIKGFIETLQQIAFPGPWGVEIISETHRRRPLQDALACAHRTTMAQFDSANVDKEQG